MSPTVEKTDGRYYVATFVVDLDGPDNFDAARFDEQAQEVAPTDEDDSVSKLKFVVMGLKMVLFSSKVSHLAVYADLPAEYGIEPACAGFVNVREHERSIFGDSSSLGNDLTREASDKFKLTVLQAALGKHFEVR